MIEWLISWRGLLDLGWLLFLWLLLFYFWDERKSLLQTKNWLKTKARITEFEWAQEGQHLWPKIQYNYLVYDQEYTGHYLFLDTWHNNPNSTYARRIAYQAAVAFEKNQDIEIYYNPFHPEQSALDISLPKKLNLIIGLLIGLMTFHLISILYQLFF